MRQMNIDTGIIPATQTREKMVRGPKRHALTTLGVPCTEDDLRVLSQTQDRFPLEAATSQTTPYARWTSGGRCRAMGESE